MATLAESFLADLEELSEDDHEQESEEGPSEEAADDGVSSHFTRDTCSYVACRGSASGSR
jgi:hypothetical protein